MIRYDIISSGSKGNCTVIENEIMIDAGVPHKALRPYIKTLRLALLTHEHSDHFSVSTITTLERERPSLRFVCGPWLYDKLLDCGVLKSQIDRMLPGEQAAYVYGCTVEMVPAIHSTLNCGYKIRLPDGQRVFYLTDTNSLDGIEAKFYDLYLLEQNYEDAEIQQRIDEKIATGAYAYEIHARENHLSVAKAQAWLTQNMGPNSIFIPMHEHRD